MNQSLKDRWQEMKKPGEPVEWDLCLNLPTEVRVGQVWTFWQHTPEPNGNVGEFWTDVPRNHYGLHDAGRFVVGAVIGDTIDLYRIDFGIDPHGFTPHDVRLAFTHRVIKTVAPFRTGCYRNCKQESLLRFLHGERGVEYTYCREATTEESKPLKKWQRSHDLGLNAKPQGSFIRHFLLPFILFLVVVGLIGSRNQSETDRGRNQVDKKSLANPESKNSKLQGASECDTALKKNLVSDDGWAELCLERSQLALDLGCMYAANKKVAEAETAFLEAKQYAEKAQDAKWPPKDASAPLVALGNALEALAHHAHVDIDKNYAAAVKTFDAAATTAKNVDIGYNAGRARYRWASDMTTKLTLAERKSTFHAALTNLFPVASNSKSPHAAEAGYWEGFTHWYLGDLKSAFDSLDRAIPIGVESPKTTVWSHFAFEAIPGILSAARKIDAERAAEWAGKAKETLRLLGPDLGFNEQPLFDEAVASHMDVAAKLAKENGSVSALYGHLERAVEYKHSKDSHKIVFDRAVYAKKNHSALELSSQDVTNFYQQAMTAIESAPGLAAAEKQRRRNDLDAVFKK